MSQRIKAILFLASQGITLFGSSIVQFAIIWYVTIQTASGMWVTALTCAAYVPQFLISFVSGVWADRHSKKHLIILSDAMIAIATLLFALTMPYIGEGKLLLLILLGLSTIRSIGTGIQTPAVGAAIPCFVPEEGLMKFNGFFSTIQSCVQFVAPAAAGAILSAGSFSQALWIDIVTAVVGIGCLMAVTIPFQKQESTPSMLADIGGGMKYAVKEHLIGKLLLVYGAFIFLGVPAGFLANLFVGRYFGNTYFYLTLLEIVGFVGMAAGGILIGVWGGFKNRITTLVVGLALFGALAIGMGVTKHFAVYLVMMGAYGVAITMVQTAITTILQEKVTENMQGRVFGLMGAMFSGLLPVGMAVFGPLADVVSLRMLLIVSGLPCFLLAALVMCNKKVDNQSKMV